MSPLTFSFVVIRPAPASAPVSPLRYLARLGGPYTIVANAAVERMYGLGGNDVLQDASGYQRMQGSDGADTFRFIAGDGQEDRVEDFELGIDKIDISLWGVTSFSDSGFSIYEAANGQGDPLGRLVIEFGGDRIRLDGLATPDIPALDESHFIFA